MIKPAILYEESLTNERKKRPLMKTKESLHIRYLSELKYSKLFTKDDYEKAIDKFLEKYLSCATCDCFTPMLIGGICNNKEVSVGYMSIDTSCCECHEFYDKPLHNELHYLIDKLTCFYPPITDEIAYEIYHENRAKKKGGAK